MRAQVLSLHIQIRELVVDARIRGLHHRLGMLGGMECRMWCEGRGDVQGSVGGLGRDALEEGLLMKTVEMVGSGQAL